MAVVSAFGFGGTDHLNTLFEGFANEYFANRAADMTMANNKHMALWSARQLYPIQLQSYLQNYGTESALTRARTLDSVKNQRDALERAGYNPLLALDGGGAGGATSPILSMPDGSAAPVSAARVSAGNSGASGSFFEYASMSERLKQLKAERRMAEAEADLAVSDSQLLSLINSAKIAALEGGSRMLSSAEPRSPDDHVDVLDYDHWRVLRDAFKNQIEKDKYLNSVERLKLLDVLHESEAAADSITGAMSHSAKAVKDFGSAMSARERMIQRRSR